MILELLALLCACGGETNSKSSSFTRSHKHGSSSFEEADSVFDEHSNEHILDDDGYCEDCDDYHDDW